MNDTIHSKYIVSYELNAAPETMNLFYAKITNERRRFATYLMETAGKTLVSGVIKDEWEKKLGFPVSISNVECYLARNQD